VKHLINTSKDSLQQRVSRFFLTCFAKALLQPLLLPSLDEDGLEADRKLVNV